MSKVRQNEIKFAFFGGEPLAVPVLNELEKVGLKPSLVVCNPDRRQGRKMVPTPPPVKVWASDRKIPIWQPETLKDEKELEILASVNWDLFVVVAYNKILPKSVIDIPKYGTLNVHPSMLPLLRGASPIRSTILNDMRENCGVSIMLMDEEMDHGPILRQEKIAIAKEDWPLSGLILDNKMASFGGELLAQVIPDWLDKKIQPVAQDHDQATYCGKISKEMGQLQIDPYHLPEGEEAYSALLKIRAYTGWPETFFMHNEKRIKIKQAHLSEDGKLCIETVTPAGKAEMNFNQYFNYQNLD